MSPFTCCQRCSKKKISPLNITEASPTTHLRKQYPLLIRGEFIALTGDPRTASILEQLLYWSQQVNDLDQYLEEEKTSFSNSYDSQYGWFSKTAFALKEETSLRVTIATFRRYLCFLIDRGWVQTRRHSQNRWAGGREYRVNLKKIQNDLQKKGYEISIFQLYRDSLLPSKYECEKKIFFEFRNRRCSCE